jgi:hypothetical protein
VRGDPGPAGERDWDPQVKGDPGPAGEEGPRPAG